MNAAERWTKYDEAREAMGSESDYEADRKTYAIRGDGALILFDEEGWFTMQRLPVCEQMDCDREGHWFWYACDPDGTPHDVYVEPVWLSGFYESIMAEFPS